MTPNMKLGIWDHFVGWALRYQKIYTVCLVSLVTYIMLFSGLYMGTRFGGEIGIANDNLSRIFYINLLLMAGIVFAANKVRKAHDERENS